MIQISTQQLNSLLHLANGYRELNYLKTFQYS